MKINKTELQSALAVVKPGLAKQDVLEQTTSFAFMNGRVVTYNDEISINHPVKGIDFTGAIKAEELYGLLQRLKKDEIGIKLQDGQLVLSCGRVRAGLKLVEEIALPIEQEIGTIKKWKDIPDPEAFLKHISFAMKTCSSDMSQLKLTCVDVQKGGLIHGSDGFRLVQCIGKEMPIESFLLSASLVQEIVKINPHQIKVKDSWIHFRNKEDTIISVRKVEEEYPSQEVINSILENKKGRKIIFPKIIDEMIDRVGQFAKRDFVADEIIFITIKKGKIMLRSEADDTKSWIEEDADIDVKKDIEFSLTPSLSKDLRKISFTSAAKDWKYVVMLRN